MTFFWVTYWVAICCCAVTGSDFHVLHAYLCLAISESLISRTGLPRCADFGLVLVQPHGG
jgi:hypothetical protein